MDVRALATSPTFPGTGLTPATIVRTWLRIVSLIVVGLLIGITIALAEHADARPSSDAGGQAIVLLA